MITYYLSTVFSCKIYPIILVTEVLKKKKKEATWARFTPGYGWWLTHFRITVHLSVGLKCGSPVYSPPPTPKQAQQWFPLGFLVSTASDSQGQGAGSVEKPSKRWSYRKWRTDTEVNGTTWYWLQIYTVWKDISASRA